MTPQYPGQRLSFSNALCTVRYSGPLPDQDRVWLGVEWDEPDRGKHDGQYKGQRLFETLSSSPNCASFIRATRVAGQPRSFLQALRYKYAEDGLERTTVDAAGSIEISGKMVEEVGFERIRRQQAVLHDLKIVLLDGLRIRGPGPQAEVERLQDEIASTCPNITELDLSRNLFEHWEDIADICAPLKKLRVLKASGLRLSRFDSIVSSAFRNVEELHLNEGFLKPDQILEILCRRTKGDTLDLRFPSLSLLSIAGNGLSTFHSSPANLVFPTVKSLVIDMNAFSSLAPLCVSLMPLFPNLNNLSLQHNQISTFNSLTLSLEEQLPVYSSITTVNLSHNAIATASIISSLRQLFPNLTSLRVSGNPFFSNPANSAHRTQDATFMLTLARLPTLTILNYSAITNKDRMDGELYYLSVAEKEFKGASLSTASLASDEFKRIQQYWARYPELCSKYERENVLEKLASHNSSTPATATANTSSTPATQKSKYPANSLGARLITIAFHLRPPLHPDTTTNHKSKEAVSLTLPRTLDVYRVKGLLMRKAPREWGLRPLGFAFELFSGKDGEDGGLMGKEEGEEIPDSTRRIGDWIGEGVRECDFRVKLRPELKSKSKSKKGEREEGERMDLSRLMMMAA